MTLAAFISCNENKNQPAKYKTTGSWEKNDPGLDSVLDTSSSAEIIAEGMDWSEGPVWVESQKTLLFSDVPRDTIFKWSEEKGKEVYLTPSGYTDTIKRGGEMGSNGLLLDKQRRLVLCQCGNRQMARMDASLDHPEPRFITLANRFEGKRFSSPNDAVFNSQGDLYFTDPPYGLVNREKDSSKETSWNGVYRVGTDGKVSLAIDSLTRPNGIAFLPGENKLLVSNSDPEKPSWYLFDVSADGSLKAAGIFYSATGYDKSWKGLPDGMKINKKGIVFGAGPGGLYVFNSGGKKLGLLHLENATSNCALSADEKTLYVTNDMNILRIRLK